MQASEIAQSLLDDLSAIKEDKQLSFVQSKMSAIENAHEKQLATAYFLVGMQVGATCPDKYTDGVRVNRHIVLLVHGIRTQGVWQDLVASLLAKHSNVKPVIVGFGYFDLFSFWFPYFFRHKPIEKVEREIRGAIKDNKGAEVSIVAHSFGTYVVSRILLSKPDIQLHRLLLCGAIVSNNFSWDHLPCFPTGGVINDVGTEDKLPALARTVSWGYGNTGTFGFRTHRVKDRYFNFGHSDFFNSDQIEKYWIPFIVRGEIVESEWSHQRPTPSWWLSALHLMPMKSVVLPASICFVVYCLYKIYRLIIGF